MTSAEKALLDAWPWLNSEFGKVRSQLDVLTAELQDPKQSLGTKANRLIACAQTVCLALQKAQKKGLFNALRSTAESLPQSQIDQVRNAMLQRLGALLEEEEALLMRAGMDQKAARLLREDLYLLPASGLTGPLVNANFDKKVSDAVSAVCDKFPRGPAGLTLNILNKQAADLRKKYGLFGAVTLAAGNLAAIAVDPSTVGGALVSKVLAAVLAGTSGGGDA